MPVNIFELLGSEKKAAAIAIVLREFEVTAEEVEFGSEDDWQLAAKAAGVKTPGPGTRARVLEMLREREVRA